jgi:proteasome lid subunit RPN8/RPN11
LNRPPERIEIPRHLLDGIARRAREGAPREVCGWLAGANGRVLEVYPVPNAAERPEAEFVMQPEAQLAAMRAGKERGLRLLGTYHSHPRTPAEPSARDRRLARYPVLSHLIVSLARPEPEIRCYRIAEDGVSPVELRRTPKPGPALTESRLRGC